LLEPGEVPLAVVDPINRGVDRSGDRIQEIQPRRLADKNRRRPAADPISSYDPDVQATQAFVNSTLR